MPYIRTVAHEDAYGDLAEAYEALVAKRGRVSHVLQIQSLDPKAMMRHLDLYMAVMFGKGPLRRHDRELIAVVVSAANGCAYCVAHHSDALQKYAKDEAFVAQVATDHEGAALDEQQRALCRYADGLTRRPAEGRMEAVEAVRQAGLDDEAILQATQIVAYFNFVNRMVHGLGVEMEEDRSGFAY